MSQVRAAGWAGTVRAAWLATALLAGAAAAQDAVLQVDRTQVNVRADATTQSARLAVLNEGEQVVARRRVGRWVEAGLPDGGTGWIHEQLLQPVLVVEAEGLRLRSGPSTGSTSMTMLFRGQEVGRLGARDGWTQVELRDGRSGWVAGRLVRAKTATELRAERPPAAGAETGAEAAPATAAPAAAAAPPDTVRATGAETAASEAFAILQRNPYAEGLQHEAAGEAAKALRAFDEVLVQDPDHVNALVHAAQAHRRLGGYDEALEKLVHALDLTGGRRDIYLTLGEVYRLRAEPDSAAKYQALFRGETGTATAAAPDSTASRTSPETAPPETASPAASTTRAPEAGSGNVWLTVGLAGIGLLALAGVGWWVVSTSTHRKPAVASGAFGKVWQQESEQAEQGKSTPAEEAELDRQIDARWRELKDSAAAFKAPPASGEGLDGVLDQVEALRQTLDGQQERARIYADIVRLQNMKIDAMTEEIRRLRKG